MTSPSSRHEPGGPDRRERHYWFPYRLNWHELQAQSALDENFFAVAPKAPKPHSHKAFRMPPGVPPDGGHNFPCRAARASGQIPLPHRRRSQETDAASAPAQRRLRPSLHSEIWTSRMFQPSQSIMSMISACAPRSSSDSRLTKSASKSLQTPGRR